MQTRLVALSAVFTLAALSCGGKPGPETPPALLAEPGDPPIDLAPSELQLRLAASTPVKWESRSAEAAKLAQAVEGFHAAYPTRRGYIAVDKPLYRPGETVWFRAFDLSTKDFASSQSGYATFELISPKGAQVMAKQVQVTTGAAANDFEIPYGVPGGEYIVQATTGAGLSVSRPIIVSSYQPPRIKKALKFLRKAYGAGDRVAAALSLERATGEALVSQDVVGVVTVDGAEIARLPLATDLEGNVVVRFQLPPSITIGDGLLTVLVDDGGVTESIQRRIPITLKNLDLALYPEGGQLIAGLPGRVYVKATNALGKPADITAKVVDDQGKVITRFRSIHDGMGRFEITPAADRTYKVVIEKPVDIETVVSVPLPHLDGCSMQAVDDFASDRDEVRVAVWCKSAQKVVATAALRERTLATAAVNVPSGGPVVVALPQPVAGEGAVRVTLFDAELRPLAERLIYRSSAGAGNKIEITADRDSYNPRDQVVLKVKTRLADGTPAPADFALAVVDDTVLSFADDKTANLLARVYLESEMPGQKVEEPNFYFSTDPLAAVGKDLVLGTHGWRRFEWERVLPRNESTVWKAIGSLTKGGGVKAPQGAMVAEPEPMAAPPAEGIERQAAKPADLAAAPVVLAEARQQVVGGDGFGAGFGQAKREEFDLDDGVRDDRNKDANEEDLEWRGRKVAVAWAPVREFPVPNYSRDYDGPRNDFRETIYWAPQVTTGADGEAEVRFVTSDSVTSFRAIAEGSMAGSLARGESKITSKLPVSLAVKMPLEVSSGDVIRLPVTIANESSARQKATIEATFGPAFKLKSGQQAETIDLAAGARRAVFFELEVVGSGRQAVDGLVRFAAVAANLRDEVEQTIAVSPRGFPQELSLAGTVAKSQRHEFVLPAMVAGSLQAELVMYPSPLATMIAGTDSIVREPYGCFEQASSANYPNIMVLDYLEENGNADPALIDRTQGMLDRGYKMLTGYESPAKGYEWFGGDPGHEALTAYGLMEFMDMSKVYSDVDKSMIARTAAWLKSRRDGKGGFQRNDRALDSFGSASPEVTNAYITYALALAGETDISKELDAMEKAGRDEKDPYILALATNALLRAGRAATGQSAMKRLAALQKEDGSFSGADHSITRSGGIALNIESTSLASLAMMASGRDHDSALRRTIKWLNDNRDGFGGYGSTQSTVLALKAITAYASHSRQTRADGVATVILNGEQVGRIAYQKGHEGELRFPLAANLVVGKNILVVELASKEEMPYSVAITYSSELPSSSPEATVALATTLDKSTVAMGEGVRMSVQIKNKKSEGIPMALARIGLPGGLTFQTWQLKELRDKKVIDFYETREREVILYFRSMAPSKVVNLNLELLAQVPGTFVAPASSAYLYYTDEHKDWAPPTAIEVVK